MHTTDIHARHHSQSRRLSRSLRRIQHVQIMSLSQSTNFASTPASTSGIYNPSPKKRDCFLNPQNTHTHQHAHSCPLRGPSSHHTGSYFLSVLPTPPVASVRHLHPLTQQLSSGSLSFQFHLLILTPEYFRPAPKWCF